MEAVKFGSKLIVRLDKGDEIVACVTCLCEEHKVNLASLSGIGAVNQISIGLFRQLTQEYITKEMTGDMEIASLSGNISEKNGEVYVHLHIVVTDDSFQAFGGHLNRGTVGATSEIVIDMAEGRVDRAFSKEIGLNLMKFAVKE